MRFTKYILPTLVIVMVGLVAFSATTFNWSGPQQTGTLSYSGLVVTNSTLGWTNEATGQGLTLAGNLSVTGTISGSVVSSNAVGELFTSNMVANGSVDIAIDLDVDGTTDLDIVDIDGTFNAAGTFTLAATALNVTNGQAITVAAGTYVLSGTGGANNTTNTITLVAPAAAGQVVTLIMATASSNLVAIADSGTVAATAALELDGNDTAVFQAVDTSTWCQIGTSDN